MAVRTKSENTQSIRTEVFLHDHLGSVDKVVNNSGLALKESPSFDPWGARRDATDWEGEPSPAIEEPRGYTGHEMLDGVGLIHMNGRVYDPATGRFLSADPHVQFPDEGVGYDRYAYVRNNPLAYTDPSGHLIPLMVFAPMLGEMAGLAVADALVGTGMMALTSGAYAATYYAAYAGSVALMGGTASKAMGGSFADGVQSGLMAGASAMAYNVIGGAGFGDAFGDTPTGLGEGVTVQRVIAHGVVGGAYSRAQGESFGSGFAAGVFGKLASGTISQRIGGAVGGAAASALVGGTASVISGGKFGNGAVSGAFGYLYNACGNGCSEYDDYNNKYADAVEALAEKPYVFGANGPDAYDCSGTVIAGIKSVNPEFNQDYNSHQIYNLLTVDGGNGARGTLMFYDYTNDGRIDHATSILGGNKMLHPSSGAAKKLQIVPTNNLDSYTYGQGGVIYNRQINWDRVFGR